MALSVHRNISEVALIPLHGNLGTGEHQVVESPHEKYCQSSCFVNSLRLMGHLLSPHNYIESFSLNRLSLMMQMRKYEAVSLASVRIASLVLLQGARSDGSILSIDGSI